MMATPPSSSATAAAAEDSALRTSADADEAKAPAAAPPPTEFLLHVAQEIRRGFHKSLTQVVADIGQQYGIPSSSLAQLETGGLARLTTPTSNSDASDDNQSIPADVRLLIRELQSARQKERELRALVDALQAEQKLSSERLALYSVLSLKLKRELINERLAHIDSKKQAGEARSKLDAGDEALAASATRRASQDHRNEEDDPWSSPGKASGSAGVTAGAKLLSFTSFYHPSARAASEDEPPSPMSSTGGSGLQPLRSSLMDQFLPSSLLDSPQSTSSQGRSGFGRKDGARLTFESEMDTFTLSEPPCTQCKQSPMSECTPCGHQLCASCEASMLAQSLNESSLMCPRCKTQVSSVKAFPNRPRQEDNQVDHHHRFLEGGDASSAASSAAALSSSKQSGTLSPGSLGSVASPITLSLLAELFDAIPVDQLETALNEAGGQASLAIEQILHTHPSFNPGAGGGSSASQSPIGGPGHKAALLHQSSLANAATSSQERTGGQSSAASSNWKTEMCMYYLQGKCNKTRRTCSFAHGESDLVRSNSGSSSSLAGKHAPGAGAFKARMCPLYLEGLCPKSRRDCPLAHGESDLRDGLAAAMTVGVSSSLPAAAPRLQSYKTELCYYYLKGCCNYTKDECRFAHGEGDLRTVESNTMEWSQKLGGGGGGAAGDFSSGPGSVSSVGSATAGGAGPPGLGLDKQLQHQHQYQQQFQPQAQLFQPQQPPPQQPPQAPPGQQQLQHGSPVFPPPPHQLAGLQHTLPHQFSPYQHHHQASQQHLPPPYQQQQGMYHGNAQTHQFRYLKSMEDAAKRGARPPPPPRREAPSWPGYEPSSGGGGDF